MTGSLTSVMRFKTPSCYLLYTHMLVTYHDISKEQVTVLVKDVALCDWLVPRRAITDTVAVPVLEPDYSFPFSCF